MNKILYLVIPCYNEEEVLVETVSRLAKKMNNLIEKNVVSKTSKILFVNDGSKDNTWELIKEFSKNYSYVEGICLSKNRGHQNALLCGLMTAKNYADIVISLDADLQDDINVIDDMILKNKSGADIVYGVRSSRKKDSFFKKWSAEFFYNLMQKLGVDIVFNHADYRLTSKKVLYELEKYQEVNLFLRGIFPLIGFKTDIVYYKRQERFAGQSKYPLKKMLSFAWDGITSFSIKPIRLILNLGILILSISLIVICYSIFVKLFGTTVSGWTFLSCSIWFLAGVQMLSIGLIGEYVGKIYAEVKNRPKYVISESTINLRTRLENKKNL